MESLAEETAPAVRREEGPGEVEGWGNYHPRPGCHDELMDADGELRRGYGTLWTELGELGPGEWRRRLDASQRIIREQGITYNVYGDTLGMERWWQLDAVPLVIDPDDWRRLEAGLVQRAQLLNRVLADCYGAQELVRTGALPPALVFGQPDFLRPCHGMTTPEGLYLHLYAADVGRSEDGQWWVISDRTQIPTGAGYALANRLVTSRVLPEAFRASHVERLASFFRTLRQTLAGLVRRRTEDPRVVMLTPGPYNETYFEQAWLARYLGYSLIEGQDLTVRDDRVWLKTLSGLEPVDVILRRVDDDWCDPLELRNDSMLGVPGLVEATRAGNVVVANALGSGLAQSPAWMAFLPGLCRELMGEALMVPSVATWWCGQEGEREYVMEHLEELSIKPAFRGGPKGWEGTAKLTAAEREEWRRRLAFQPHAYVAQERVDLSTAPCWDGRKLTPLPVALRVYLVATGGTYRAMSGGLARVSPDPGGRFVSLQRGGASKDVWVLADGPVEEVTLLPGTGHAVELRRVGNNLPSRLADNFFWLGRYAERADATARLLRATLVRFNPENSGSAMVLLEPLLKSLAAQGQLSGLEEKEGEWCAHPEALEAELLAAVFDPERKGSVRRLADELQRLATLVRDRTSNDLWRVLSTVDDRVTLPPGNAPVFAGEAVGILNQTILGLASFHGLARENMTRAQGWRFLDMGVRVERAIYLATFLDAALRAAEADNPSVLEAVLEVADSSLTYRSRYTLLPQMAPVYDLVLLDDTNPRSLVFQLNQLVKHLERLPRERQQALPSEAYRRLLSCVTRVRLTDPRPLAHRRERWEETEVGDTIRAVLADLPGLSDALAVSYFAHSETSWAAGGGQ